MINYMLKGVAVICMGFICLMNSSSCASSVNSQTLSDTSFSDDSAFVAYCSDQDDFWIDTIMFADGHCFGRNGDFSTGIEWFFDSVYVGDDQLLTYDSIAPSALRLSLIARDMVLNMGDPMAADKIKGFLEPVDGFKRFTDKYEVTLDSVVTEENEVIKSVASFDFVFDYVEDHRKSDVINRFVCNLACESGQRNVNVNPFTALYIGYNPSGKSKDKYNGNAVDMAALSNYISKNAVAEWVSDADDLEYLSTALSLAVRASVSCPDFITFSRFRYDRLGIGHGMYTETFHTLDLNTGKHLTNKELFSDESIGEVKMLLFETIAADPRYRYWYGEVDTADVMKMMEGWQAPDPLYEATESEELQKDFVFTLPDGALTNEGVVFSFQPYEIACWAAGTFHFVVPYSKLHPYMTLQAKTIAGLKQ